MGINKNKRKEKRKIRIGIISGNKGAISVYLCMMLAVMMTVILTMIEAARISAINLQLECATDMGLDSVFAEYHRELFDRYGLLFIDSSYGNSYGSVDMISDRLRSYMEYNLKPQKGLLLSIGSRDLLGLDVDSVDILRASRATDNNGEVFKYAAVTYMLDKYGIGYIDDVKDLLAKSESNRLFDGDIVAESESTQKRVKSIKVPEDEENGRKWSKVDKRCPTERVGELRSTGILSLICEGEISQTSVDLSQYASYRSLVKGDGLPADWKERNSLETELLFNEYILLECGNYVNRRNDSLLQYETEYVLYGKNSDVENLKSVATRLLLIRGADNTRYFLSHRNFQAEAEALAAGVAIVTLLPEFKDIYKAAIIAAWILSESVYDVKIIFKGGKVPLLKGEGDWNLSLSSVVAMTAASMTGMPVATNDKGLSYKDYLRLLLYITDKELKVERTMDVVEMDIRNITNKESFSLDNCIASIDIQMICSSIYGYTSLIKRSHSYH